MKKTLEPYVLAYSPDNSSGPLTPLSMCQAASGSPRLLLTDGLPLIGKVLAYEPKVAGSAVSLHLAHYSVLTALTLRSALTGFASQLRAISCCRFSSQTRDLSTIDVRSLILFHTVGFHCSSAILSVHVESSFLRERQQR